MTKHKSASGKVGIVHSYGYGAAFSDYVKEISDSALVEAVLKRDQEALDKCLKELAPGEDLSWDVKGLTVTFVPEGVRYFIREYDGSETVVTEHQVNWRTA